MGLMTDFKIEPFRAAHALSIPDIDTVGRVRDFIQAKPYLDAVEQVGTGFTLFVEDKVVGSVVFLQLLWPSLAEAIMFISRSGIKKHRKLAFKLCRDNLDRTQREHGWVRMQSKVFPALGQDVRWARHLGFLIESTREAYGPDGEDVYEMVRICKSL
jgi:hypothetical protein